jgi:hypothetical protein
MPSRLFLTTVFFLIAATIVESQARVIHISIANNSDETSKEVSDRLSGKLGSTLRYALTSPETADLLVDIVCVKLNSGSLACTHPTRYYPDPQNTLSETLPAAVIIGDSEWVAQSIFDNLVRDTSDEKLKALAERLTSGTSKYWLLGYDVGLDAGKNSCVPKPKTAPKQ